MSVEARFRLRFLLQELELHRGVTTFGRSPDCEITLEDPLVSRRHAQLVWEGPAVTLCDLGSRNGVKVNGQLLRGARVLAHGDRVRIGTMEFVFIQVGAAPLSARVAGFLRACPQCGDSCPPGVAACPRCGHRDGSSAETISYAENHRGWEVVLLLEMLERALELRRVEEADRLLGHLRTEVESATQGAQPLPPELLEQLALGVLRAAMLPEAAGRHVVWLCELFQAHGVLPAERTVEAFCRALQRHPRELAPALQSFCRGVPEGASEALQPLREALQRVAGD